MNNEMREILRKIIENFLDLKIIQKSNSSFNSPLILVRKPNNEYRACADLRQINECVEEIESFPLVHLQTAIDFLQGNKYFVSLDLSNGFYSFEIEEACRKYFAFSLDFEKYEYVRVPMGYCGSPAFFIRCLSRIFGNMQLREIVLFCDDLSFGAKTLPELLIKTEKVFNILLKAGLKVRPSKCCFAMESIDFLGFTITENSIAVSKKRIDAINSLPPPKSPKQIQRFIGAINFVRKHIQGFSTKVAVLTELIKKNSIFKWTEKHQTAFEGLKEALISQPVLTLFDSEIPISIHTDVSEVAAGAVLVQNHSDGDKIIAYYSKKLTASESNFFISERELFAVILSLREWSVYVRASKFKPVNIYTDHLPIVSIKLAARVNSRLLRWLDELLDYPVKLIYKKGTEHHLPDLLSRPDETLEANKPCAIAEASRLFENPPIIKATSNFIANQFLDLFSEQHTDEFCQKLFKLVISNDKVKENFYIYKGVIYKFSKKNNIYRIVVPNSMRNTVLFSMHDLSGHLGTRKTYYKIKERYFWNKIRKDVTIYCKTCKSCQINKPRRVKPVVHAGLIPFLGIFEIFHIDICTSFSITERGNKHIVSAVDRVSKFIVAKAIPDQTAITVAKFVFENIICLFGPYRYLISDLGGCFISEVFESLHALCPPASQLFTTSYHASSNGSIERVHSTIKASLRTTCEGDYESWDLILPSIVYAINTSYNVDLQMSPYQFIFHLKPRNSLDFNFSPDILYAGNSPDLYSEKALQKWENVVEQTRQRLIEKAVRRAQNRNEGTRKHCFLIGDTVLLKNIAADLINPTPFKPKYKSLYLIIQRCSPSVYEIQKIYNPEKRKRVSVEQLELWHERHPEFELSETNFRYLTHLPQEINAKNLLDYKNYKLDSQENFNQTLTEPENYDTNTNISFIQKDRQFSDLEFKNSLENEKTVIYELPRQYKKEGLRDKNLLVRPKRFQ